MSKASRTTLEDLHAAMAEAMQKKLDEGSATASDFETMRKFLLDNGINSDGSSNPALRSLSADLDDLDDPAYAN